MRANICKIALAIYFSIVMFVQQVFAYGTIYTNIPNEFLYTNMGYIWYSQSGYQEQELIGYWDGYNRYYKGNSTTMANPTMSGCGPISFAIIASNCRNELITPKETIQYFCDTGLYTGNGSSHNCGIKAAKKYGLNYEQPSNSVHADRTIDQNIEVEWMRKHLEKGHWIQILVKNQPNIKNSIWSYSGGHYVAIHGYKNGKTYIYDSSRKDYLEVPMDLIEVWQNIRHPYSDGCGNGVRHMTAIW